MTPDMWHLTPDIWHVTPDKLDVSRDTQGVMRIVSKFQVSSSYGLGLKVFWRFWTKRSLNEWINNEGVCRTALATPGLLISFSNKCWPKQVLKQEIGLQFNSLLFFCGRKIMLKTDSDCQVRLVLEGPMFVVTGVPGLSGSTASSFSSFSRGRSTPQVGCLRQPSPQLTLK